MRVDVQEIGGGTRGEKRRCYQSKRIARVAGDAAIGRMARSSVSKVLVDLREGDLDGAQTVIHAAHIRFQPVDAGVDAVEAGVDVTDRYRHGRDHDAGHYDDGADHAVLVTS